MGSTPNPDRDDMKSVTEYYEQREAVSVLSTWYSKYKEREFVHFLLKGLALPDSGYFVEIGGGTGTHGLEIVARLGDRYVHSDFSAAMVEEARAAGLCSIRGDGTAMPFADETMCGILMIGTTTIVRDQQTRTQQFRECARLLVNGGFGVFVTGRLAARAGHHSLNREDIAILETLGFQLRRFGSWGIMPGRFWRPWNAGLCRYIERVASNFGVGLRRVVIVQKCKVNNGY